MKSGDMVCFIDSIQCDEYYGGVYEVLGQTLIGMYSDETVIMDSGTQRRVANRYLRLARAEEISAGRRL